MASSKKTRCVCSFVYQQRDAILYGVFCLLVVAGILLIVFSLVRAEFNAINYLSAGSAFVIALLTAMYVLTTTRQLEVMRGQLDELKKNRELEGQPLPWIREISFLIDKPRVFYAPPEPIAERCKAMMRFHVPVKVRNIGNSPAVCIDAVSYLRIPREDKAILMRSDSIHIGVLEEKQDSDDEEPDFMSFIVSMEKQLGLLNSLQERNPAKLPTLMVQVYYRNVLGGCFYVSFESLLMPQEGQYSMLKNWYSRLISFSGDYMKEVDFIQKSDIDGSERMSAIEELQGCFADTIEGDDLEVKLLSVPDSFQVEPVEKVYYKEMVGALHHPVPIPPGEGCFIEPED